MVNNPANTVLISREENLVRWFLERDFGSNQVKDLQMALRDIKELFL